MSSGRRIVPASRVLRAVLLHSGLTTSGLWAQQAPAVDAHPDYTVRQWTVRDGLPSNAVNDVLLASDGYLWLATLEGVVRFDGQRFTVFNATNTPAIPGNRIAQLAEGPPGHLWIRSSPNGLTHYHDGLFTRAVIEGDSSGVALILHEGDETVWVATNDGLANYQDGRLRAFRHDSIVGGANRVVRDQAGRLWVGTLAGTIYRVDTDGTVRGFTTDDGVPPLPVSGMLVDGAGALWVSLQGGLVRIADDRVEAVPHSAGPWPGPTRVQLVDAEGNVWVSADPEGWWRFAPSGGGTLVAASPLVDRLIDMASAPDDARWRVERQTASGGASLEGTAYRDGARILRVSNPITGMAFGARGNAWIATGGSGLFRIGPRLMRVFGAADGLPNVNVYPILEDRGGQFWVGTFGDGVAHLGTSPLRPIEQIEAGSTLSLHEDQDGAIWVGRFGLLCRVAGDRCVDVDLSPVEGLARQVRAMHEDRQGRFWIGGNHGLAMGTGAAGQRTWTAVTLEGGLPPSPVRAILELQGGEVLFGTGGGGVLRYVGPGRFDVLGEAEGLPSNQVRDLHEDADGFLWIALEDRGLCRLDRRGATLAEGTLACADSRSGLYHDGLHRLLEDDDGRFWFNTNNGIFWVERAALNAYLDGTLPAVTSIAYTEAEGMLDREGNGGMQPAGIKASNGDLWFPTRNGVVIIDPDAIRVPQPPPVAIEQVRVAGAIRPMADTVALDAERDITFNYTALELDHSSAVRFEHRLSGYEDEWQYAGEQHTATYTNLAPGTYVFEVRALLGSQWDEPATLIVTRAGYLWEQTWFHALLALAVLGAGFAAYRVRLRRIAVRNEQLEWMVAERTTELRTKTEELEEANSLKSRFLANISHEFRTPLTLTFGPIDDLLNERFHVDTRARPHLERARSNGKRLLRLINQLLDLSRLDARMVSLHAEPRDLGDHLRQLAALFAALPEERRIRFVVQVPDTPREHVYDPDKVERVVINLLSNAFKFTKAGDKVSLTLDYEADGTARIEVADTGPGIAAEHVPRLFDRFYQVESASTRKHEGTGIGLALVKELVELHGGDVMVESTPGFGTSFRVRLPPREADTVVEEPVGEGRPTGEFEAGLMPPVEDELATVSSAATRTEDAPVVLVVEDNADMRAYIRGHLEEDFHVIEAEDGRSGFELASEYVPDLVLSDIMMPDVDGLQLCAMIKGDERTSHIPIVLLTARSHVESRIEGFESGADGYLSKPFNAEELRARVQALIIDRRRLRARFASLDPPRAEAPALPPREAAFLERVRTAVEARLADSTYGVDRLAEELLMSPRQLYRKLGALTGETPAGLIRQVRMNHAKELLATGRYSVKQVARQVGFKSRPSFSAAFRQTYGVAPSDPHTPKATLNE